MKLILNFRLVQQNVINGKLKFRILTREVRIIKNLIQFHQLSVELRIKTLFFIEYKNCQEDKEHILGEFFSTQACSAEFY
jgi:hypothetical protein